MHLDASVSLSFNGECEAAFKVYERLLGAKPEFVITWGASPLAACPTAGEPAVTVGAAAGSTVSATATLFGPFQPPATATVPL